jgi:hypothetical protein
VLIAILTTIRLAAKGSRSASQAFSISEQLTPFASSRRIVPGAVGASGLGAEFRPCYTISSTNGNGADLIVKRLAGLAKADRATKLSQNAILATGRVKVWRGSHRTTCPAEHLVQRMRRIAIRLMPVRRGGRNRFWCTDETEVAPAELIADSKIGRQTDYARSDAIVDVPRATSGAAIA